MMNELNQTSKTENVPFTELSNHVKFGDLGKLILNIENNYFSKNDDYDRFDCAITMVANSMYTKSELSEIVELSQNELYTYINNNYIEVYKLGDEIFFYEEDIDIFIELLKLQGNYKTDFPYASN